jgi:hypothetical protein
VARDEPVHRDEHQTQEQRVDELRQHVVLQHHREAVQQLHVLRPVGVDVERDRQEAAVSEVQLRQRQVVRGAVVSDLWRQRLHEHRRPDQARRNSHPNQGRARSLAQPRAHAARCGSRAQRRADERRETERERDPRTESTHAGEAEEQVAPDHGPDRDAQNRGPQCRTLDARDRFDEVSRGIEQQGQREQCREMGERLDDLGHAAIVVHLRGPIH